MDKIAKMLNKLTVKEREQIKYILSQLSSKKFQGLDIKKLKGSENIFRVRKGNFRIIYRTEASNIFLISIERRHEDTYKL